MSKKHSAVLAVILLFCFALCGCVGQVSGEASHSPSNGASVEPSPTVSEEPKPSVEQIGFEAQCFEWDLNCTGYEASTVIVNSRRELEEYYKNNKKDKDYQLELIEKLPYDDAFLPTIRLY